MQKGPFLVESINLETMEGQVQRVDFSEVQASEFRKTALLPRLPSPEAALDIFLQEIGLPLPLIAEVIGELEERTLLRNQYRLMASLQDWPDCSNFEVYLLFGTPRQICSIGFLLSKQ